MKRADLININYLIDYAEDIINNTNVLFPEWLIASIKYSDDENLRFIWKRMYQKHQVESGNWYIFGRGDRWIGPNETHQEAEDRIVHDYCEATGHWDLFIWKEVKKWVNQNPQFKDFIIEK